MNDMAKPFKVFHRKERSGHEPRRPVYTADSLTEAYNYVLNRYENPRELKEFVIFDDINETIIRIANVGYQYQ